MLFYFFIFIGALVSKLCKYFKQQKNSFKKQDIKFCDKVIQCKMKKNGEEKNERILVVEDDVIITFVQEGNDPIKKSKQYSSTFKLFQVVIFIRSFLL